MPRQPASHRPHRPRVLVAGAGLVTAVVIAVVTAVLVAPLPAGGAASAVAARRANPVTPGNFSGYGFDQCLAPTQKAMDAWLESSPFWAVGIYIAGNSRHCRNQPNLTPTWVATQLARGWRLLPITLGPQAYCNPRYPKYDDDPVIRRSSADNYAAAYAQGKAEAGKTVTVARGLGLAPRSTLWYDLEAFDISNRGCRLSALRFLSGWTERIRALGYVSGVYSSGASGIKAIDDARVRRADFTEPDMIWVADWSGRPGVYRGAWLRAGAWLPGRRVHQYRGGHDEVHGGVRINIDSNFLDVGRGSRPKPAAAVCGGVRIDFARYAVLDATRTARPAQTKAAQCLLRRKGHYDGALTGVYDARTGKAVAAYRATLAMTARPTLSRRVWTALHASGTRPLMKYGAFGPGVRRLQRALNSSTDSRLAVTGTFEGTTTAAVKRYQSARRLPATGVVTDDLWARLQTGR